MKGAQAVAEPLKNLLHPASSSRSLTASRGSQPHSIAIVSLRRQVTVSNRWNSCNDPCVSGDALLEGLPRDFPTAAAILEGTLPDRGEPGLIGWALLPVSQFVAARGLDDFELSLLLLRRLTPYFTGEFGIRAFIHQDQHRALATISRWVHDDNHHVRRLASEGTRPRLPWAMRLPKLIRDPEPIFPILTALIDDPSDYVRRSVANSLNDIAKDHPDLVAKFVAAHMDGASPERFRLLRHASRTLLKQGHKGALANFGFSLPSCIEAGLSLATPTVRLGGDLLFGLTMRNSDGAQQQVMIDYAVHHRKANGSTSPKVFKWTATTLEPGSVLKIERRHPIRPITTRRYYPGTHRVVVLVNGKPMASADFELAIA